MSGVDYFFAGMLGLLSLMIAAAIGWGIGYVIYITVTDWWEKSPWRINSSNAQEKFDSLYWKIDTGSAVRKCLKLGAIVNETHIYQLVHRYNLATLKLLLEHDSSSINKVPPGMASNALGLAVRENHRETIHILRRYGARTLPKTVQWALQDKSQWSLDLLRATNIIHDYGVPDARPPLYDALDHKKPDFAVVEYLLYHGARIEPVIAEFQRTFARSGSFAARQALNYLKDIKNARLRLDGIEVEDTPNIWDHLDQESSQA